VKRAALVLALLSCRTGEPKTVEGERVPTATTRIGVGSELGVVTIDATTYIFDRARVTVMRDGIVVARIDAPSQTWDQVAELTGPDGTRWAVALSGGVAWRVTSMGGLDLAGARLGVGDAPVRAIAATATTYVLGLDDGVAVSRDGKHVSHFPGGKATLVAAARDAIAIGSGDAIEVYDLATSRRVGYRVAQLSQLGFVDAESAEPRLVAVGGGLVYVQRGTELHRIDAPAKLTAVAIAGSRVWMLGTGGIYALERRSLFKVDARVSAERIFAAPHGDVWIASKPSLQRLTFGAPPDATSWAATIEPVFERACAKCHRAGGAADFDLSTEAAWKAAQPEIYDVLAEGEMPPEGEPPLSVDDRAAIARWMAAP